MIVLCGSMLGCRLRAVQRIEELMADGFVAQPFNGHARAPPLPIHRMRLDEVRKAALPFLAVLPGIVKNLERFHACCSLKDFSNARPPPSGVR